jgi:hypothetical protein
MPAKSIGPSVLGKYVHVISTPPAEQDAVIRNGSQPEASKPFAIMYVENSPPAYAREIPPATCIVVTSRHTTYYLIP